LYDNQISLLRFAFFSIHESPVVSKRGASRLAPVERVDPLPETSNNKSVKTTMSFIIFILIVLLVGVPILLRISSNMDRVEHHYSDTSQLAESTRSWIPFDRHLLDGAKEISMSTDVDTNQFIIRWKYSDSVAMNVFRQGVSKVSRKIESEINQLNGSNSTAIGKSKQQK
jgi:hypothetical protein